MELSERVDGILQLCEHIENNKKNYPDGLVTAVSFNNRKKCSSFTIMCEGAKLSVVVDPTIPKLSVLVDDGLRKILRVDIRKKLHSVVGDGSVVIRRIAQHIPEISKLITLSAN